MSSAERITNWKLGSINSDGLPIRSDGKVMSHAEYMRPTQAQIDRALDDLFGINTLGRGDFDLRMELRRHEQGENNTATGDEKTRLRWGDAQLTDEGKSNGMSEGQKFYGRLAANTHKEFDVFVTSPLSRCQETQAYLKQAQHLHTSKEPKSITLFGLREYAQAIGSCTTGQSYDGPVIAGTALTTDHTTWKALTLWAQQSSHRKWREHLTPRAQDVKYTLFSIASGIHRRTGREFINMSVGSHSGFLRELSAEMLEFSSSSWDVNGECAIATVSCTQRDPEPWIETMDWEDPDDRDPPSDSYKSMLREAIENGKVHPLSHYCSSLTP